VNNEIDLVDENPIDLYLQEQALNLSKVRAKWNANRSILSPIVNALHKLKIEPTLHSTLDVSVSGDAKRLADVVRIFMVSGFKATSSKPKAGDTTWHSYFSHPNCSIDIWFYFTSSVCKRVKVGTKMVEQDVYEVQCGDIASEALEQTDVLAIDVKKEFTA
jgi:hypothetical protein